MCDEPQLWPFHMSTGATKSTTEKRHGVISHHAINTKVAQPRPTQSSRRVVSLDIAIQGAEEGAKAGKKRHKQHHQEATTNDDGGTNERADIYGAERGAEDAGSDKHQVLLPTYHFERLLEETCPNHTYPIKHKLRDCGRMKSFMTTRSLS
jgi:hypothetical protein